MSIDGGSGSTEAERWCQLAGRLLEARDLLGCKRFAERSMEADPLVEGADQIVAAADVLLASQRRINNHLDWYSILLLKPTPDGLDCVAIRNAYRRLALLLNPDRNGHPSANLAFKLVSEAWAFLSDPDKKRLYDDEIKIAAHVDQEEPTGDVQQQSSPPSPASFWTMCSGCFRAYEFAKEYENRTLLCQNCRKVFRATELPTAPPVVPGTDMYYCSWGLFPLGFPGAPVFNGVVIPEGTVCIPAFPGSSANQPPGGGQESSEVRKRNASGRRKSVDTTPSVVLTPQKAAASATPPVANSTVGRKPRKSLASKPKKQDFAQQQQQQPPPQAQLQQRTGISLGEQNNNTQGAKNNGVPTTRQGDFGGGFDMNSFSIDLDHTAEVLGNLVNLPFLKDDEIATMR